MSLVFKWQSYPSFKQENEIHFSHLFFLISIFEVNGQKELDTLQKAKINSKSQQLLASAIKMQFDSIKILELEKEINSLKKSESKKKGFTTEPTK